MLPGEEEDLDRARAEPPSRATARLTAHPARRCTVCETTYSGPEKFCPFDGEPLEDRVSYDPFADPLLGKTVSDRYRVEAVLGQGGMGTVYRVRHQKLESAFAMKVLHPDLLEDDEVAPGSPAGDTSFLDAEPPPLPLEDLDVREDPATSDHKQNITPPTRVDLAAHKNTAESPWENFQNHEAVTISDSLPPFPSWPTPPFLAAQITSQSRPAVVGPHKEN